MRVSHFSCEPANKCLNVCEWVEVVERNKSGPCLPLLSRELSVCERVKENQIEKEKKTKQKKRKTEICRNLCCMYAKSTKKIQRGTNYGFTLVS